MTQPDTSDFRPSRAYRIAHDLRERVPCWSRLGGPRWAGERHAMFDMVMEGRLFTVTVEEKAE